MSEDKSIKIEFDDDDAKSKFEFEADMAFLNVVARYILESPGNRVDWPHTPILDQLLADMTPTARRAVLAVWPVEEVAA